MLDLEKLSKQFDDILHSEDFDKWHEEYEKKNPPPPKGWIRLEDRLPQISAESWLSQGYEEFLVKDSLGKEFMIPVTADSMVWFYDVAHLKLTHWFNPS